MLTLDFEFQSAFDKPPNQFESYRDDSLYGIPTYISYAGLSMEIIEDILQYLKGLLL